MNDSFNKAHPPSAVKILGVTVDPLTIAQLNDTIAQAIDLQQKWIIANQNLHSIYIYHHESKMRAFYDRAKYIHIDSMAIVLLGKLLGLPLQRDQRVTYVDWTNPLMAVAAERGWRIFYLGSKPGVAERGIAILQERFKGLQITGANGYFNSDVDSPENARILDLIDRYQPQIVMVGMGMPRQEYWILNNLDRLNANVILPCGATIDYVAGAVPTPPRWAGKIGLEWLFRLVAEPKRLWRRYLLEPWFLLRLLLIDGFKKLTSR
ncbi:WecB/TagA/CpsF family glycosyltransferase [Chamaesiphon sp. VAR_69_metabat_338]|uniref:WecB/TagA/CpsF family glycosyltransferase n=1 Tax=Chamaesiphon sp. VAR_69_metabat_338 TaxID=2964704 RepID=UPI00286E5F96|nr:WecB/TagA/CpsF family glycosyltransferase [Chamaesiphon sp. VAR_69_metabat_338]